MQGNGDDEDEPMMWMDEAVEVQETRANVSDSDAVSRLEAELARTRTELAEVRKDLAAKVDIHAEASPCSMCRPAAPCMQMHGMHTDIHAYERRRCN